MKCPCSPSTPEYSTRFEANAKPWTIVRTRAGITATRACVRSAGRYGSRSLRQVRGSTRSTDPDPRSPPASAHPVLQQSRPRSTPRPAQTTRDRASSPVAPQAARTSRGSYDERSTRAGRPSGEGRDLLVDLVVPGHVGDEVSDRRERAHRLTIASGTSNRTLRTPGQSRRLLSGAPRTDA